MKLKSLLLILVLSINISFASSFGPSYTPEQIYENFKDEADVDDVKISPFLMALGGMLTGTDLKGISSLQVLDLTYCAEDVIWDFKQQASRVDTQLELFAKTQDSGDYIEIYAKTKGEVIKELLIIITGDSHLMMRVKGNIKLDQWIEVSQSMI